MKNTTACVAICSELYMNQYAVHKESLDKWLPNTDKLLYKYEEIPQTWKDKYPYIDVGQQICALRPRVVLDAFSKGYTKVIFLGADVVFYNEAPELFREGVNAIVTPHILNPLWEDGLYPSPESLAHAGHINSDVVVWNNTFETTRFLLWQDQIHKTKCINNDSIFLDQTWLNFLPFTVRDVYILKHPGYNVAYWNYSQRLLRKFKDGWVVGGKCEHLVCFQFSGIDVNHPELISKHQNRHVATDDFLQFLKEYCDKIK